MRDLLLGNKLSLKHLLIVCLRLSVQLGSGIFKF